MRIGSERDLWIFGRELIRFSRDTRTCTVLCISYFLFGIWHLWNGFFYISETAPAIPGVAQTHVQQTSQRLKVNDDNDNDGDDNDDDDDDDYGGDDDYDDMEAHSVQIITGNFGHLEYSWVLLKKDPWIGCMGTKGPSGACISYNQVHVSVAQGELCEMHEFQNLHKLRYLEMS